MDEIYEITPRNQIFIVEELVRSSLYGVAVYYVYTTYLYTHINQSFFSVGLLVTFIVTQLIPSGILHFQYYEINKATRIIVDKDSRTLTIESDGTKQLINLNQIEKIRLVLGAYLYKGRKRGMNSWDLYHHAIVEVEGGKRFIITCLLINDLRNFFDDLGLEVVKIRRVYPFISIDDVEGTVEAAKFGKMPQG